MKYYPTLDGLRFFAVFLVIISHWLPDSHMLNYLPNGAIGVTIFFVLSGYLISKILFVYKDKIINQEVTFRKAISTFVIRRSFRIFPIYYILIFFLFFYGYRSIQEYLIYYLSYTSNILFFNQKELAGTVSHLWTLAVEEQFYLFWPILILLTNGRYLKGIIYVSIILSTLAELILTDSDPFYSLLTFTTFHSFGLGALVAYCQIFEKHNTLKLKRNMIGLSLVVIALLIAQYYFKEQYIVTDRTAISLFSSLLILQLTTNETDHIINRFLSFKIFVFVGKISYGVYLFHTFIPGFTLSFISRISDNLKFEDQAPVLFVIQFVLLILLCSLSWYLIEMPINRLKAKFKIVQ
ncbi:MAG: acyltransferase [Bacteroidota bacterium]